MVPDSWAGLRIPLIVSRAVLMGRSGGRVLRFVMILERSFGDYLRQSVTVHLGVGRLHPPHVSVKWTSVD